MKYCIYCGSQMADDANFCTHCGKQVKNLNNEPIVIRQRKDKEPTGMQTAAYVFMIIATVIYAFLLIPLAWCIPMTVSYHKHIKNDEPVDVGFKVCTLLFVSVLAGIFMLVDDGED